MKKTIKSLALALAICLPATMASAVSVSPFGSPLAAGDATNGNASVVAGEAFAGTTLSFSASESLLANISTTVNPYQTSLNGGAGNEVTIDYTLNGGALQSVPLASIFGPIGGASIEDVALSAGDVLTFIINGVGGASGNQVTFAVETRAAPVVPLPAAGFLLMGALGGLALMRKRAA